MNHSERNQQNVKSSAVERAIERLKDESDPNQWITVIEAEDEIDEEALNQWLVKRGYKIPVQG